MLIAAFTIGSTATATARPHCFGAASRAPGHRCSNPRLRHMVTPTPEQALLMTLAPCSPIKAPISACTFGTPAGRAKATVALVGDSHAEHWRATLWPVTQALGWSGLSLTESSCALTRAVPLAPSWKQHECADWNSALPQYLSDHPEIGTIFTSNHPGKVVTQRGESQRSAKVAGIIAAWNALPASVQHIVVIRDDPFVRGSTLPCVERAIHAHADAGHVCAFPRRTALRPDYYVEAARQLRSPRVQVVDLTHFFCGRRLCYPVVGGALVYRDYYDHLTRVFATTLGPYLLDRVRRLMATWH